MSFSMIVGRYEIVATSGVENGSVRVGKSEAEAYDVIDRKRGGHARLEKQGVTLDTAWCVFRTKVTGRFGIVTGDFGNVTGRFGNVTERTGRQDWRCA